jgi:maltooligosyltrehalose trehalohydrolase
MCADPASSLQFQGVTRQPMSAITRRFPAGAEVQPHGGTHFRVWAPDPRDVSLVIEGAAGPREIALEREPEGYHSVYVSTAAHGTRYQYRLDGHVYADPASRFQPDGPFGPSQVVDASRYRWAHGCPDTSLEGQVIYEMHVGTFTREGTWRSATGRLPALADTGITMLELMPVAEFPGRFGWGYDGVFPFAPTRLYGNPDDFRGFVDRAHELGLAVILDVVYNHLGPDGCVFAQYAANYFARHYENEWGDALNFDGPSSAPVRDYFASNAAYWIAEFQLDGLRLDATQAIHDQSPTHILAEIAARTRAAAAGRHIVLIAENEPQDVRHVRPRDQGGYGLDALWNDDFHHSAVVALTGRREAYYTDHRGAPQEFISAAKHGYLFQGQRYAWQKQNRGTPTRGVSPAAFVNFIENHDQLANSGDGSRLHQRTAPGRYRAMAALFVLMPGTPMLFQGQEFGARQPFLYFADHKPELAAAVQKGRAEFVSQFTTLASPDVQARLPVPHDPCTFERCKLDWENPQPAHVRLYRDLLAVRREDAAFRQQRAGAVDGAVLGPEAFVLRYWTEAAADERLLIVNFATDLTAFSIPEPLLAPPAGYRRWTLRWSSEHADYGGIGTPDVVNDTGWRVPGHCAVVLQPGAHTRQDQPEPHVEQEDGGDRADIH